MLANLKKSLAQKILSHSKTSCKLDVDKLASILSFTPVQKNSNLQAGLISLPKSFLSEQFQLPAIEQLPCLSNNLSNNSHVTFTIPSTTLIKSVLEDVSSKASKYGSPGEGGWYGVAGTPTHPLTTGLNVVVDYSSPNIAKPFHMGHLRSTVIGRFVVNVNRHFGQSVTSVNFLGDWGTQFGYLSEGFRKHGSEAALQEDPINHLHQVYKKIHADKDPDIHTNAMEFFKKLEAGDPDVVSFWQRCRQASLEQYKHIYKKLSIEFDAWLSESQYAEEGGRLVEGMVEGDVARVHEDGTTQLEWQEGEGRAVLLKSDHSSLYLTRDLASAVDRVRSYGAERLLYVVDRSQEDHFKQLQRCLTALHHSRREGGSGEGHVVPVVDHVRYGRVEGMSTRKGVGVLLEGVVDRMAEEMEKRMRSRKTTKVSRDDDVREIAEQLGVTAVVVNDLKRSRMSNYSFRWDEALNFNGDSGLFLQYSHARLHNLLAAFDDVMSTADLSDVDFELLTDPAALRVVQHLARYEEVLLQSYVELEACHVVQYLFTLGRTLNLALKQLKVKHQSRDVALARLFLFKSSLQTLNNGLLLLGVKPMKRI